MDARTSITSQSEGPSEEFATSFDLRRHIAVFRRRMRVFIGVGLLTFAVVLLVTLRTVPLYTANTQVMLDSRKQTVVDLQQVMSGLSADTSVVDTEVEVLKSRALAEKVVASHKLEANPEFNPALGSRGFMGLFKQGPKKARTEAERQQQHEVVVDNVRRRLKVTRSGLTYVINIAFQSENPRQATTLANAFAERYLVEQLDAKFEATQRASQWLNSRLGSLRQQVEAAESAVQQYKSANGLMSAAGNTLTEQDISNLNQQLATTLASQAEQEARLATARRQLERGSNGGDVGEALNSPVVQQLRAQRAEVSRRVADLAVRYGPLHQERTKAERQLADIDGQIQAEIQRVISNLDAQAQVARQRTASLQASLGRSRSVLSANNNASVRLNELERNAESVRTLYQSFLDRFKQTTAQSGIEQSDANILSPAKVPTAPSSPNVPVNLALGVALGVLAGLAALVVLELLDVGLSTSVDVERRLGVSYLGSLPLLSSTVGQAVARKFLPTRYVVEKPLSAFSEGFRNLRASLLASMPGEGSKIIAITSSLPREGKTTTSVCLARTIALSGRSVVVVDCDLRRRTIYRLFEKAPSAGLIEVLEGTATLDQALLRDNVTTAMFLSIAKDEPSARDVFGTPEMDKVLADLRKRFEIILLDTAPILPIADTRVLAPKADGVLFLTRWRKTHANAAASALRQLEACGAHILGVALTQVDVREQARTGYGDAGYYHESYKSYYLQ